MKMHNLNKSFNIVIKGKVLNNDDDHIYDQYDILADFPIQTNLVLTESQDPFLKGDDKYIDRLNIEALQETVLMRISSTHITKPLESRVKEMFKVFENKIKIPDSPV
jgi:hypothetical protein